MMRSDWRTDGKKGLWFAGDRSEEEFTKQRERLNGRRSNVVGDDDFVVIKKAVQHKPDTDFDCG